MTTGIQGIYYPEGVAPFGEMTIILPHKEQNNEYLSPSLAVASDTILTDAWSESNWLGEEVAEERITEWADAKHLRKNPDITAQVYHGYHLWGYVTAFAVASPSAPNDTFPNLVPMSQVKGVGTAKAEQYSTRFRRMLPGFLDPIVLSGNITHVDVRPNDQGQHISVALLDGLLSRLPQDVPTATWVPKRHGRLRDSLAKIGFNEAELETRPDLFPDGGIQTVRMRGDSVRKTRETLAAQFPWLRQATIIQLPALARF